MRKFVCLLILIVLFSGCTQTTDVEQSATDLCIQECQSVLNKGQDLSNGPCLSNEIVKGWVCDITHSPRQDIDNKPENQCSAYREGIAKHFVEVDTNCKLIRAV